MATELSNQSVVIVGNGASLLNGGNGRWIDSHDVVVRFNLFQIEGFSDDVGTKTTVWFNNRDAESAQIRARLQKHTYQSIYVHTWQATEIAVTSFNRQLLRLGRAMSAMAVDKKIIAEMSAYLGENYSMFSTGAIGTWVMLKQHKAATLTGFDWWRPFQQFHYCDAQQFNHQPKAGHQPLLEKQLFEKLCKDQRLKFHP